MFKRVLASVYREIISDQKTEATFWVLLGFGPALALSRLTVHLAPSLFLSVHSAHVHHFTYGIIILAVAGYLALVAPGRVKHWVEWLYGVGLALAFDEFGTWLHLTNNYNLDLSEDVTVFILLFLIVVVYSADIARRAMKYIRLR